MVLYATNAFSATLRPRHPHYATGPAVDRAAAIDRDENATVIVYCPVLGRSVNDAIADMVELARRPAVVVANLNGTMVEARCSDSAAALLRRWRADCDASAAAWRASVEGVKYAQGAERSRQDNARRIAEAINDLPTIDLRDCRHAMEWLTRIADRGIAAHAAEVLRAFEAAGYVAGACTGDDFDGENPENYARYIVGQGMSGIAQHGAAHPLVRSFFERWTEAFGAERTVRIGVSV